MGILAILFLIIVLVIILKPKRKIIQANGVSVETTFNDKIFVIVASIVFVLMADFLFWGFDYPGGTFSIFSVLLLVPLFLKANKNIKNPHFITGLFIVMALLFSVLIEPGFLNVTLLLAVMIIFTISVRLNFDLKISELFSIAEEIIRFAWRQIFNDIKHIYKYTPNFRKYFVKPAKSIGIIFAFSILALIFIALFSSANPLLSKWLTGFWNWIEHIVIQFFENISIPRLLFWFAVLIFSWAHLRFIPKKNLKSDISKHFDSFSGKIQTTIVIVFLSIFNLIFLIQNIMDVTFLWGHAGLPEGLTYASYAHQGAYSLMFTALLAGLFVLTVFRKDVACENSPWAKGLVYFWIAQNIFILFSSLRRLILYVDTYGLTLLRISAFIWMVTVAAGFILILWRIIFKLSGWRLVEALTLLGFIVLFSSSFINFKGYVAWYNVKHCRQLTGDKSDYFLDYSYLKRLGPETLPALNWLKDQKNSFEEPNVVSDIEKVIWDHEYLLKQSLSDWRGWTLRRNSLKKYIKVKNQ